MEVNLEKMKENWGGSSSEIFLGSNFPTDMKNFLQMLPGVERTKSEIRTFYFPPAAIWPFTGYDRL